MLTNEDLKILIWTVIPNHYQASFHEALRSDGIDLRVCYYEQVHEERLAMGWDKFNKLPEGEMYVPKSLEALDLVSDWKERIHVLPGYGDRFLIKLVRKICSSRVKWVHWTEPAHPGLRWWVSYPVKRWYANLVNRFALGAFGNGNLGLCDFRRWGIKRERLALLPYSSPLYDRSTSPDKGCSIFASGRRTFLFLGSLNHRKGVDLLLSAFAVISKGRDDIVLLLAGNDLSNGGYVNQAKELGILDRVLFRGPIKPSDLAKVLACGQVLVLPSRFDGWGVVLNEAASAGLALIGSDMTGASHHLIEPGFNGFRFKAGSVTLLADAMRAYVHDPELATVHGKHSLTIFAQYTPERNANRFLDAIHSWMPKG